MWPLIFKITPLAHHQMAKMVHYLLQNTTARAATMVAGDRFTTEGSEVDSKESEEMFLSYPCLTWTGSSPNSRHRCCKWFACMERADTKSKGPRNNEEDNNHRTKTKSTITY